VGEAGQQARAQQAAFTSGQTQHPEASEPKEERERVAPAVVAG
jgi:hypothetical protein